MNIFMLFKYGKGFRFAPSFNNFKLRAFDIHSESQYREIILKAELRLDNYYTGLAWRKPTTILAFM